MTENQDAAAPAASPGEGGGETADSRSPVESGISRVRPGWPVWLALAISVIALAGVALLFRYQASVLEDHRRQTESGLAVQSEELAEIGRTVAARRERIERLSGQLDRLADRALADDALRDEVRAVERELTRLEEQLAARLDAMDDRLDVETPDPAEFRRRVLMQETLALLRLGQDRAELAGDTAGAVAAYAAAEARLGSIGDSRLGPVRRQLARELAALEAYTPVDWQARQGRLQALADGIKDWPVKGPESSADVDSGSGKAESESGLWNRLTGALGGLVRIERSQPDWLTPVQAAWLKAGLNVRFQIAELAAARGDADAWREALTAIRETMDAGLDMSSERMRRVEMLLESLAQLPDTGPGAELGQARRRLSELADST